MHLHLVDNSTLSMRRSRVRNCVAVYVGLTNCTRECPEHPGGGSVAFKSAEFLGIFVRINHIVISDVIECFLLFCVNRACLLLAYAIATQRTAR